MKAITLWQPWASLIFAHRKKYETRSWPTFYRGPLAIHAARRKPPLTSSLMHLTDQQQHDFEELLCDEFGGPWAMDLPRGSVLGTVMLTECKSVAAYDVDAPEQLCGNWTPGRFAWRLDKPERFPRPVPADGAQRLWNWDYACDETLRTILDACVTGAESHNAQPHQPSDDAASLSVTKDPQS